MLFDQKEIPDVTELYRQYDNEGVLLYIGISYNSADRAFYGHKMRSAWWKSVAKITIERYPNRLEAAIAERAAIISEKPIHNKVHSPSIAERLQIALPVQLPPTAKRVANKVVVPQPIRRAPEVEKLKRMEESEASWELHKNEIRDFCRKMQEWRLSAGYFIRCIGELIEAKGTGAKGL